MKKITFWGSLFLVLASATLQAQCLQIESILVDACNAGGFSEPYNEMVRFKTGTTSIPIAQLSIAGKGNAGAFAVNKWPNQAQLWHGLVQNANTASKVSAINATVLACGFVKEPPAGIIPASAEVIMVCSQYMSPTSNSFANLNDTIYMVFQDTVSSAIAGHFANYNSVSGFRSLVLIDNSTGCTDTVKYDVSLLPLHTNGDGADYDAAGNPTYINRGCQAPYVPLSVDAGPDQTICFNSATTFTAVASGLYSGLQWTLANAADGTLSPPGTLTTTFTPSGVAVSPVKVYVTLSTVCGNNIYDSLLVTITQAPTPTLTSSNGPAICMGDSTVLNVNNQSNTTYSWSPLVSSATSVTVTPSTQTVYTITATNNCASTSTSFTVNVIPVPVVVIANDSICLGTNGTLHASGASTYTWSTGASGDSIVKSPSATQQFTVTGTDLNGCKNTATGIIFVNPLPAITVNSPSVCPGSTVTLTAAGASTFTWSTMQTGSSISVNPSTTTSYTVAGTDVKGCQNLAVSTVTIFNPNVTVNNPTICPGNSATITASGASTYTWSTGANGASISVTPASNTSYTVFGTDVNGCKDTAIASVTIVNSLTVTAVATGTMICQGSPTTLNGNGANTYTWSPAGSLSASTGASVIASPTVTTTYTVIGSSGSCADTNVVTINVNSLPTVSANASQPAVCAGATVTLTGGGAQTYTWTGGVSNGIPFSPAASQTYTVTGTDVNGCSNTAAVNVVVDPLPNVTVNSAGLCPGATATLTANGASTYTWSTTQSGNSISVSPSSPTNYTVTGTDANGCVNVAVSSVIINALPTVTVNSPATCQNASATLTASGATTYSWSTAQSGASITVPGTAASYTVTGTSVSGCTNTAVASVSILPLPTAQAVIGNTVICGGQSEILSTPTGPYTYSWNGPGGMTANGSTVSVNQAGVYTLTATNSCGSASSQFTVAVSVVHAGFAPNIISGQAPATFTFTNSSTGTQLSDYWNMGNGSTTTISDPIETYTVEGSYVVTLVVTDLYGCKDSANYTVFVSDTTPPVIIPNVFTPNGDSINDVFSIKCNSLTYLNCQIYDRWGLLLYEWNGVNGGWDGKNTKNGLAVSDGTYYFLVTYMTVRNKLGIKNGFLQLIK